MAVEREIRVEVDLDAVYRRCSFHLVAMPPEWHQARERATRRLLKRARKILKKKGMIKIVKE